MTLVYFYHCLCMQTFNGKYLTVRVREFGLNLFVYFLKQSSMWAEEDGLGSWTQHSCIFWHEQLWYVVWLKNVNRRTPTHLSLLCFPRRTCPWAETQHHCENFLELLGVPKYRLFRHRGRPRPPLVTRGKNEWRASQNNNKWIHYGSVQLLCLPFMQ